MPLMTRPFTTARLGRTIAFPQGNTKPSGDENRLRGSSGVLTEDG